MTVSRKTTKKIGLATSISMLIGSVVGIGIFFKNGSVFDINDFNSIGILVSWILSAIIVMATAYSFAEVGSTSRTKAGLAGWTRRLLGQKMGRFVKLAMPLFYYGILILVISVYSIESILKVFNAANSINIIGILCLGFLILIIFLIFNYLSTVVSGNVQVVATSLKFIPLIIIGLGGIIFGAMHASGTNPDGTQNLFTETEGSFNFANVLTSIPAILFAFDSFLCVGNLSSEMGKPKRDVPLTIVIGIALCAFFYLFVTVGQLATGEGTAYGLFSLISNGNAIADTFVSVFIMISILGVLNALSAAALRSYQSLVDEGVIYRHTALGRMGRNGGELKSGLILGIGVAIFWLIVLIIPSAISNNDSYVDGISNFPTLFFFAIYGLVILGAIANRFTKKIPVDKVPGFLFVAPIAVIGCALVFFYQFFYAFIIQAIMNPNDVMAWGLFANQSGYQVHEWQAALVFFSMFVAFISIPFINDFLLKREHRNSPSRCMVHTLLVR